jgi:phenylacetate-CoA ligase
MSYRRVLRLLTDVGVTVAWCMPTEALLWAETARLLGMSTKQTTLRALVVAGEPLARARKARLEALLGARVFEDYGSTETGSLAGECTAGALHLWADRFVPEVVDPETGASSREGVGRLAITTLFRQAMPLVRFLLDDTVEVSHRPCSCGWALPIVRVLGRPASLMRVANVPVSMVALDEVVFSLPASLGVSFWRARPSGDALAIEIETAPEAAQVASAALASGLHERLGITAHVRAVGAGTIVPHERLLADAPFMKPRFLFAERESWDGGAAY